MSECASGRVERDCKVGRFLSFDEFQYVFGESEKNGHVRSLGIYHRVSQECVIHLEDKCMSVYQE